jgi:hypothetical protein
MLHASGLALLLAQTTREPVELVDQGTEYLLSSSVSSVSRADPELIERVLILPSKNRALPTEEKQGKEGKRASGETLDLPLANLDGLLTTLFTIPGVRALSVADVIQNQQHNPLALAQAIDKVAHALSEWKNSALQTFQRDPRLTTSWLERLLLDYDLQAPALPFPVDVQKEHDLSLVMTLDPTFSYSSHRTHSDGLVTHNTNLTIRGASFAVLLALIGAARFLRAQRLSHGMVNCYVPLAARYTISASTALPPLSFQAIDPEQALLLQWLGYTYTQRARTQEDVLWKGLAYQTIQTQGIQQSLSCQRGCLDLLWPLMLNKAERGSLLFLWRHLLWNHSSDRSYELGTLFDALANRQLTSWIGHLLDMARCVQKTHETMLPRSYRWKEVKTMADLMHVTTPASALFQTILRRKGAGTLRIGRALRLLGRANRSGLLDRIEELEKVQTLNQLNYVLALAIQECALLEARTPFIIIPDENDARLLCADVEQSDPHTIASFLILLSTLEYPGEDGKQTPKEPMLSHSCTF